jgi:hypothetical protein
MTLTEGHHADVPMDVYVGDPCPAPSLSRGTIHRLVTKSPAHARYHHPRLNPDLPPDDSSRADLGSAIHAAILGGKRVVYAEKEYTDWRKKGVREWRDKARAEGNIPVLDKDRAAIEAARGAAITLLRTLPGWNDALTTEGTLIWKDGPTWLRGRFDIVSRTITQTYMVDVKTTSNADPSMWIRTTLLNAGYDIQSELYQEGARANGLVSEGGEEANKFLFLLIEIEPPFCCSLVGLGPAWSSLAQRKIAHGKKLWAECMKSGQWPGYTHFPHWADPLPWNEAEFAEKEAAE